MRTWRLVLMAALLAMVGACTSPTSPQRPGEEDPEGENPPPSTGMIYTHVPG